MGKFLKKTLEYLKNMLLKPKYVVKKKIGGKKALEKGASKLRKKKEGAPKKNCGMIEGGIVCNP